MARLTNISGKEAAQAFQKAGWHKIGQVGSHLVMVKSGVRANLSIPQHKELSVGTLRVLIRNSGLSVDEFLEKGVSISLKYPLQVVVSDDLTERQWGGCCGLFHKSMGKIPEAGIFVGNADTSEDNSLPQRGATECPCLSTLHVVVT